MGAGKELWVLAYDCRIEELAEENDLDYDQAEKMLQSFLDEEPGYLDDYHF